MKSLQFELWEECNCRCSFCYLGNNIHYTSIQMKLNNIQKTLDILNNIENLKDINCIALIGGEFFQGQLSNIDVKNKFILLIDRINFLLEQNIIQNFWISASLIYGTQNDLYEILKHISTKSKMWILTSYDVFGRFKTENDKQNWIKNLMNIRNIYPEIHINITSIITGKFIKEYLNDNFELKTIANNVNAAYFLKPPCQIDEDITKEPMTKIQMNNILPEFFPSRSQFLQFLNKYKQTESELSYLKLYNMNLRSDILYKYSGTRGFINRRIKDKSMEIEDDKSTDFIDKCGHSTQYQIYIDSDACCICDKMLLLV